jgi:hypothetical protein
MPRSGRWIPAVLTVVAAMGLGAGTAAAANHPAACTAGVGDVAALRQTIVDSNAAGGPDSVLLGAGCT